MADPEYMRKHEELAGEMIGFEAETVPNKKVMSS